VSITGPTGAASMVTGPTGPAGAGGGGSFSWATAPANSASTGAAGAIAYDANYFYVATSANYWKRTLLSEFSTDASFANVLLLLHAEGSGSSFVDSSSAARTITASGGATQSTTQFKWGSKSASFNGSSSTLAASIPAIGNTWTVECWVYLTSRPAGEDAAYITDFRTGNGNNYTLGILGSSGILYFYGNGSDLRGTASITTGAWHHVAFVNDGGSVSLYLDGSRCGTTTKVYSQGAATVVIGSRYSQDAEFVNGYIDDLRISTVARYAGATLTIPTAAFPDA
jgi:hypothetical protein